MELLIQLPKTPLEPLGKFELFSPAPIMYIYGMWNVTNTLCTQVYLKLFQHCISCFKLLKYVHILYVLQLYFKLEIPQFFTIYKTQIDVAK